MIEVSNHSFEMLSATMLYEILRLRAEIFVVEQNVAYQDLDSKDQTAQHFIAMHNSQIAGYGRVLFDEEKQAMSMGRIVTAESQRKKGIARKLITAMLSFIEKQYPDEKVVISAQCYIQHVYASFGFISEGEIYLEDTLPHIKMIRYAN